MKMPKVIDEVMNPFMSNNLQYLTSIGLDYKEVGVTWRLSDSVKN